jgi:pimeloyl-ACP methyl ester carboxylesterase
VGQPSGHGAGSGRAPHVRALTGTTAGVSDSRVSSQRRLWNWLHAEAPDLITPDLCGRADGVAISGPFSLAQHVDDLIMILDELEIDSIHICGMSMGGFVAMRMAAQQV